MGARVFITNSVKHDHDELRDLIGFGMAELDESTEVHVKARNVRFRYEVSYRKPKELGGGFVRAGGARSVLVERFGAENVRRLQDWGPYWCSGLAYHGVPGIARVERGTLQLVTLTIPNPAAYACNTFPFEHVYPGKRASSAPWPRASFVEWRDDVVHTSAHEARHVLQHMNGEPTGEMEAERYACERLMWWRLTQPGKIGDHHPFLTICDAAKVAPDTTRDDMAIAKFTVWPVDLVRAAHEDFERRQREAPSVVAGSFLL